MPGMEDKALGERFEDLTNQATEWREGWLTRWAPQDGRFSPTPAADGEPKDKRWEMLYWLGAESQDATTATTILTDLGYGYEVMFDTFSQEYVVMTDFLIPAEVRG